VVALVLDGARVVKPGGGAAVGPGAPKLLRTGPRSRLGIKVKPGGDHRPPAYFDSTTQRQATKRPASLAAALNSAPLQSSPRGRWAAGVRPRPVAIAGMSAVYYLGVASFTSLRHLHPGGRAVMQGSSR